MLAVIHTNDDNDAWFSPSKSTTALMSATSIKLSKKHDGVDEREGERVVEERDDIDECEVECVVEERDDIDECVDD